MAAARPGVEVNLGPSRVQGLALSLFFNIGAYLLSLNDSSTNANVVSFLALVNAANALLNLTEHISNDHSGSCSPAIRLISSVMTASIAMHLPTSAETRGILFFGAIANAHAVVDRYYPPHEPD